MELFATKMTRARNIKILLLPKYYFCHVEPSRPAGAAALLLSLGVQSVRHLDPHGWALTLSVLMALGSIKDCATQLCNAVEPDPRRLTFFLSCDLGSTSTCGQALDNGCLATLLGFVVMRAPKKTGP